ncbi:hypothetical protein [Cellulomonas timonensis]|uniref:hypothetical protein n=1 Tax=Cellulomonas timonensis TaxID=1689271 RepID=UPI000834C41E|nr:hypothetical protein [Cellulomonas timonensis]
MSQWSGAPQASQFAPTARGLEALFQRLETIELQLRALTGANILSPAGIGVDLEGMTIASSLAVTGNMLVQGTLALPAGIIGNEALATPVGWGYATDAQDGFGVGTAFSSLAPASFVVPPGFTSAALLVFGKVRIFNPNATADWLNIECGIAGALSGGMPEPLPAGYSAHEMLGVIPLTGITGGQTLTTAVRIQVQSTPLAPRADNLAYTRSVALYFRG